MGRVTFLAPPVIGFTSDAIIICIMAWPVSRLSDVSWGKIDHSGEVTIGR